MEGLCEQFTKVNRNWIRDLIRWNPYFLIDGPEEPLIKHHPYAWLPRMRNWLSVRVQRRWAEPKLQKGTGSMKSIISYRLPSLQRSGCWFRVSCFLCHLCTGERFCGQTPLRLSNVTVDMVEDMGVWQKATGGRPVRFKNCDVEKPSCCSAVHHVAAALHQSLLCHPGIVGDVNGLTATWFLHSSWNNEGSFWKTFQIDRCHEKHNPLLNATEERTAGRFVFINKEHGFKKNQSIFDVQFKQTCSTVLFINRSFRIHQLHITG